MERERRSREYWEQELSEYWDSGLTVQEYSELKELPYESVRRWIRRLKQERPGVAKVDCNYAFRNTEISETFKIIHEYLKQMPFSTGSAGRRDNDG